MTTEELKEVYSDKEWQDRFVDICDLLRILGDCIIGDDYSISDALNASIVLSSSGSKVQDQLARKREVKPNDAKLMCALTIGHDDLFIDVEGTSIESLCDAISRELLDGRLKFPLIFGRDLYDRYAAAHEHERDSLPNDETMALLEGAPIGVFQYGRFSIGPFGVVPTPISRRIEFNRRVPVFHCHRPTCPIIHLVDLETSTAASINRNRHQIRDYLKRRPEKASDWEEFSSTISGFLTSYFAADQSGTVIPLVGDCFSLDELRDILVELLDCTDGRVRHALQSIGEIRSATEFTAELDRAQLLQLALFAEEGDIISAIDKLVTNSKISLEPGEVRRAVVNTGVRSGAFRLYPELGTRGIRLVSEDPGLALLRTREILDELYASGGAESDPEELTWRLRDIPLDDVDERLENFFQNSNPTDIVDRLVLSSRANMAAACKRLGVSSPEMLDDAQLASSILWKLGFSLPESHDPHADFWVRHERLWALIQSSEIGASEQFIEAANPYFSALEGLLHQALGFTTWALLTDHVKEAQPFSFSVTEDLEQGLMHLTEHFTSKDGTKQRETLGSLISAFNAIANKLENLVVNADQFERDVRDFPEYDGKTSLKSFVFRSTIPFLDLSEPSQRRIVGGLRDIGSVLLDKRVADVRNDYSHYRRTPPDVAFLEDALDATRSAVTKIETLGLSPIPFSSGQVTADAWGRSRHEFVGPRSYRHIFVRPSRFDWMGLPLLSGEQFLMRAASFDDPSEVLRFTVRYSGGFSELWRGYPNRRKRRVSSSDSASRGGHSDSLGGHSDLK